MKRIARVSAILPAAILLCAGPAWAQTTASTPAATPASQAPVSQAPASQTAGTAATVPAPSVAQQMQKMQKQLNDWPNLSRYRAQDAALPPAAPDQTRVVFYGDSITDGWGPRTGGFFPDKPNYVNRGISGQTTPQMLVRFEQDVVHLKPAAVVILAGTNDIAGNTGPSTQQMIEDNFISMAAIAKANGIKMIVASVTPAAAYPWKPGVQPAEAIRALNVWLKEFCAREGLVYLDYYSSLANEQGGMRDGLSRDGVHPTAQGYAIMAPLAEKAIAEALAK